LTGNTGAVHGGHDRREVLEADEFAASVVPGGAIQAAETLDARERSGPRLVG
jgi:hypothetical protein